MARKKTRRTTTKRKKTTRKRTSRKSKGEVLLVGSKVKSTIKKNKCNTAGDAVEGLNTWAHWLIEQACNRAKANGRKTVRAHDFISM